MEGDEPCFSTEAALHIRHVVGHAGNIKGSDVEDLHGSDKSLVESAAKNAVRIELFFEPDQVH